jgi:hypothetical protein
MAWDNKNLLCHNCKHWWPTALADLPDHSRRYPAFATTKRDDWCGDHAHKEM